MDAYVSENASIGIRGPLVVLSHAYTSAAKPPMLARSTASTTFTRHIYQLVEHVAASSPAPTCTGNSLGTKLHTAIGCSMGGVLVLRFAMLCPGTALPIISCDSHDMMSLETSKASGEPA
jgi:hypothetical protein